MDSIKMYLDAPENPISGSPLTQTEFDSAGVSVPPSARAAPADRF